MSWAAIMLLDVVARFAVACMLIGVAVIFVLLVLERRPR